MKTVSLESKRKKITDWVNKIEDKEVLDQMIDFINNSEKTIYDPAYEASLSGKEKIEYWKKVGISGDELLRRVYAHIDTLPWKK
ncbi:MAG: hypothetical protein GX159_08260 [Flavobacteriaceae bacterium]|jgi:hypothetical protein|nr:hypothetical protein [Flavobacteriaceae bacterium]